jgi:hypothetical protein
MTLLSPQMDYSIVVSLKFIQCFAFKDIIILARMTGYMDHLVKEATWDPPVPQ